MLFQDSVTLDDVFSFLVDFRADESLCRGTFIWKQVCFLWDRTQLTEPYTSQIFLNTFYFFNWLWQLCSWLSENSSRFKPRAPSGGNSSGDTPTQKETVRSYVEEEILTYLRVPPSTGLFTSSCKSVAMLTWTQIIRIIEIIKNASGKRVYWKILVPIQYFWKEIPFRNRGVVYADHYSELCLWTHPFGSGLGLFCVSVFAAADRLSASRKQSFRSTIKCEGWKSWTFR